MTDPDSSSAAAAAAVPVRRARPARWLGGLLLALLVLLAAVAGSVWWAARTEAGSAWLLGQLPGVRAVGPRGTLLGDLEVQQLTVRLPGGADSVTLTGVGWTGLTLHPGQNGRWLRIGIDELHANRVDVVLAPSPAASSAPPRKPPKDLALPIELELRALRVVELHATPLGDAPVRDLRAALHLGADGGAEHRLERLSLTWDRLQANASGRVATAGAMPLEATVQLSQQAAGTLPAWAANATLQGPLAGPHLQATLRAQPADDRPAQSLDASADLRPFAAWPLGELQASVAALDLSAFGSALPETALTGRAIASSSALDQPARVAIDLANAAAGRWNEQRLPLRHVTVDLGARPGDLSTLDLGALDIELGSKEASAGHLTGQGRWTAAGWTLEAQGRDLRPEGIDARAAPMRLNGPISLAGAGDTVTLRTTLAGRWTESGPVRDAVLALDASYSPLRMELRSARAEAGRARATLAGTVTRADAAAPWAVKGQAGLVDFDPAPWWPGAADSPWRRATTKINAGANFDLVVPADLAGPPAGLLAALRGEADVKLAASTLVGVPLEGTVRVRNRGGNAPAEATLRLDASGNHVQADGRIALTGNGASDAWTLAVDAAALDRLAPVLRLFAPAGIDATLAGSLKAQARVTGRWPSLSSQGQLDARALRAGPASVRQAEARWQFGTAPGAIFDAEATLADAALAQPSGPGPSLDSLKLRVQGTGRAHTLDLQAVSKALPPAWVDVVQAGIAAPPATPPVAAGSVAHVQAQGGFVESAASAWSGWRGRLQQVDLRSSASPAPLLAARDVAVEALWSGGPARVSVQPGRADVLGGSVRWSAIAWAAAGADGKPGRIDGRIDIEPLRIAPLLARAQPGFGWGGDLALAGHVALRSAPTFSADIAIERSAGDLTLTDELGTQSLGITQLRLGLVAADGVWTFTPALAGRTVGIATGAVVVRTAPTALWPGADAALQGALQLDLPNLGTLGPWLPPGWRVDGALRANARIGGRFGAPEYNGDVTGSKLALRNFLQGVNIGNGELRVVLRGDTAHIERFSATAGTGTLGVEGDAVLGAAPHADLKITAARFQLLGRADRRIVTSGQARLRLDSKTLALDGGFGIDEGLIDVSRSEAPALSEDVHVVRARGALSPAAAEAAAVAPPPTPVPGRNVAIDLRVTMGEQLHVRGHGLDAGLRGELKITSPQGRLAVNGSISTADGTYQAYGQKLTIDRGVITFVGPVDNPLLDIEATRPKLDIRVGVAVSGPVSNPRIRLFSEPDLSDIDKLSWLVMGKASDGLGRTDTALLQRAALALVSGEGPGTTDKLIKSIGLDELSVGQQTNGDVKETVVSLGKQLSARWYVGYERGLNATAGSWQLIYRLAQRLTVRAQAGGDSSLDLIWTWRWQ